MLTEHSRRVYFEIQFFPLEWPIRIIQEATNSTNWPNDLRRSGYVITQRLPSTNVISFPLTTLHLALYKCYGGKKLLNLCSVHGQEGLMTKDNNVLNVEHCNLKLEVAYLVVTLSLIFLIAHPSCFNLACLFSKIWNLTRHLVAKITGWDRQTVSQYPFLDLEMTVSRSMLNLSYGEKNNQITIVTQKFSTPDN